ncbi:restriction endonuclease subunit S [Vagococcus lutrae]|uniref:restriction endonuclease subunit S n=1 Tax=Vagococcus lutrae TaxID=81947 RepID=UPI00288FCD0D|nr:restriction endonuclease subunit S [Vagococcus lutrae]MDT2841756.1 restriction endonuclease subunit S [Vagococcus lutrae]
MSHKIKTKPEIRFSGYTDDWEQRKLSQLTKYKNGKGYENKVTTNGRYELINLNSISIDGGLKHSGKFIDETDETLNKDDLVMILSDVGHGDLLGRVALIPENDRFVLNQRVALLRPTTSVDAQFLFTYINQHQKYFKSQGAGMSQLNISKGSVENFTNLIPSVKEQQKIGTFFKQLDDTIALHQRQLEALEKTKKSFLQKMFPKKDETKPEIRFAGFTDDWEQRKLGEISKHRGGTAIEKYFSDNGQYKVISIGSYGLNSNYIDQGIRAVSNEITDSRVVNSGELTMVLNDKTANGSIIGRSLLIEENNKYVINQRTEIISPSNKFD